MAYDEDLAERVRSTLTRSGTVEEKYMFGSLCFMVGGKMRVSVRQGGLLFRVAPDAYDAALSKDGCGPMIHGGRTMKGFVLVRASALQTPEELAAWLETSLAA